MDVLIKGELLAMTRMNNLTAFAAVAALSVGLAACGGGGGGTTMSDPDPTPQEMCEADGGTFADDMCTTAAELAVESARTAAAAAATAADAAAEAAEAAANAQMANMSADEANYALAQNAATRARTASDAASAASDAAVATDDPDEAERQQSIAEAQQGTAEEEQANAEKYAGMVATAQRDIDAENQRVMDVAAARVVAMKSYMDADADATRAEAQAAAAEATASGTPGAMAARQAATDARTAATNAKTAHDAITDGMTKAEADAQATEAATQAGLANAGYMTAKAENDDIQTAAGIGDEQLRVRDVAAATEAAEKAADAAREAATNAATHATNARTAANAAKAAYERAKSARTDSKEANTEYMAANTAAMAAESAATSARMAAEAAEAAHMGIDSEGSVADAQAAQRTAEARQGDAAMHAGTANTQLGTAEMARDDAMTAANTHMVGLLMMANAAHIDADDRDDHIVNVNTAVSAANASAAHGGGTITAVTYPYWASLGDDDAIGGTGDDADTGPGEGLPAITITPTGGTAISLRHADAEADPAEIANFAPGSGLGDFGHEKYISGLDATTTADPNDFNGQRVILFTDLEQGSMGRAAQVVRYINAPVVQSRIASIGAATGEDYAATYDHDGDEDTAAIAITLNCGTNCSLSTVDGEVTSISGYTFSTADTGVTVAAVAPADDDTWIGFGMWLVETVVADGTNTYAFGAFADGGAAVGDTDEPSAVASVTGDATYSGKASGVHSTATAVDFFHADATLNAKFGDGTEIGTITGMIHNIFAGGDRVTGSIELVVSDPGSTTPIPANILDGGTFSGRARMGNTGMQDSSGEDVYTYTGTWAGAFYNHMATDATADVDPATMAPGSIAGTFGVGRADVASTMDMDETESYVGAFGAHCSGSNCNPH
ncbi:MAG: hypothetical protein OXJ90_24645 [Spirochaetaceae bacterium]|nr:hypothetical protein [Spirochaetaceae bacterium]